jgi:hypothetical protein
MLFYSSIDTLIDAALGEPEMFQHGVNCASSHDGGCVGRMERLERLLQVFSCPLRNFNSGASYPRIDALDWRLSSTCPSVLEQAELRRNMWW